MHVRLCSGLALGVGALKLSFDLFVPVEALLPSYKTGEDVVMGMEQVNMNLTSSELVLSRGAGLLCLVGGRISMLFASLSDSVSVPGWNL